jgi:hypothetical protein
MVKLNKQSLVLLVLPALIISVFFNLITLLPPSPVIGVVYHTSVGQGTDSRGEPTTWYTVSLWLLTEDRVNGITVGDTIAYIVDKDDFDRIIVGDVVKGVPLRDLKIEVKEIIRKTGPSISISIVSSEGRCGNLESPLLTLEKESEGYVLLRYLEGANVPCYRHVIDKGDILEKWPPIIEITLKLESTSDVCVECIGIIETILRIGPVPDGTEIVVNDLRVVV